MVLLTTAMNIILIDENEITADGTVTFRDRRFLHMRDVLRISSGKQLKIGMINGLCGIGTVVSENEVEARIAVEFTSPAPKPLDLILIVALPRPKSLPRLIQTITSLGAKSIYFINALKVAKDFWSSDYLGEKSVRTACLLGLEQAGDTILPQICFRRRFKPFVEDELPALAIGRSCFVAHPYAETESPQALDKSLCLALGPEGGWDSFELGLLEKTGFTPVKFSRRILRLETAVTALVARSIKEL